MTTTLTLTIPASHVGDLAHLFELEREGVLPREALTYYPDPPRYVLDCDSEVVSYLLEQLVISTDLKGGQSLVEWRARNMNQVELPLGHQDGTF
jgi:hypothetical protein